MDPRNTYKKPDYFVVLFRGFIMKTIDSLNKGSYYVCKPSSSNLVARALVLHLLLIVIAPSDRITQQSMCPFEYNLKQNN